MSATSIIGEAFVEEAVNRNYDAYQYARIVLAPVDGERRTMEQSLLDAIAPTQKNFADAKSKGELISPFGAEHAVYSIPIVLAMSPRKGWEVEAIDDRQVDPRFDTPFFRKNRPAPSYDEELHINYMAMLAISAAFTNDVFARIARELDGVTLNDPDQAKKRVIEIYKSIPASELKAILLAHTKTITNGRYSTDLTGSGNIHFINQPAGDFVADARGVSWTKGGGVWFGDGKINGRQVSFRLASTTSLQQRQSQTGTNTQNTDAKVNGSGNVGPGK
jgi:hypothetical protein